jgi:hypothetical protein
MFQHLSVDSIDYAINQAIVSLRYALPDFSTWSGPAANACANSIEALTAQLENLRARLSSWQL